MPVRALAQVLAHQGGWDEFLWIAGPLLIVGGLLWLANRRANALNADADGQAPPVKKETKSQG